MSITHVLKNTLKRPGYKDKDEGKWVREKKKEGHLKARRNIIRDYDSTFMCCPHVGVLLFVCPSA